MFMNGTQTHCMFYVTENMVRYEISYNKHCSVNSVPYAAYVISVSSTCDNDMNPTSVPVEPGKHFLCFYDMYLYICHYNI